MVAVEEGSRPGNAILWSKLIGADVNCLAAYQGHEPVATAHSIFITWACISEGGFQVNRQGKLFSDDESLDYSEKYGGTPITYAAISRSFALSLRPAPIRESSLARTVRRQSRSSSSETRIKTGEFCRASWRGLGALAIAEPYADPDAASIRTMFRTDTRSS